MDERGGALVGLGVEAVDAGLDIVLGRTASDDAGRFRVAYSPTAYRGIIPRAPDVLVRLTDSRGLREVARAGPFTSARDRILDVPTLRVPRSRAEGWKVTLDTADAARLTRGNRVRFLVDRDLFDEVHRMVGAARERIHLMQLWLDPDFAAHYPEGRGTEWGVRLLDSLIDASRRGVEVRLLMNRHPAIPDSVDDIRRYLRAHHGEGVRLNGFGGSVHVMHSKVLVVDDRGAVLVGPPFQQKFWDTSRHLAWEPRRSTDRPTHDVSLHVEGPAVASLVGFFAEVWNFTEADPGWRVAEPPAPPPAGAQSVQLALTAPPDLLPGLPEGEGGVLEAHLRALGSARDVVYVETQYFTNASVVEAIDGALRASHDLEVILLLNEEVDVPGYVAWQAERLDALGHPFRERFGVFTRASVGEDSLGVRVASGYVHAGVIVADDAWASLGTANLDSASLEPGREFGVLLDPNVDASLVLFDGVDGEPATGVVGALRRRLWSEHLALDEADVAVRPPEGWLALWRRVGNANLAALRSGRKGDVKGFVYPYDPERRVAENAPPRVSTGGR